MVDILIHLCKVHVSVKIMAYIIIQFSFLDCLIENLDTLYLIFVTICLKIQSSHDLLLPSREIISVERLPSIQNSEIGYKLTAG